MDNEAIIEAISQHTKLSLNKRGAAKETNANTHAGGRFGVPRTLSPLQFERRSLRNTGPLGPESKKSLKKSLPGLRPRGPKKSGKVSKKSEKSDKSLEHIRFRLFRDFSRTYPFQTFSRLFPDPGAGAPGDFFRLFLDFGPGGPARLL